MCFGFGLCVLPYSGLVVDVGRCYMLLCIVVRLRVLGDQLVLMVEIIVRVFLQKYMDFLEKKCV